MSQPPAYTPVGAGMPDILDAFYGFLSTYLGALRPGGKHHPGLGKSVRPSVRNPTTTSFIRCPGRRG